LKETIMGTAVYCTAASGAQASEIVDRLRIAGFASRDISVLMPDSAETRRFAHQEGTKAPEGAAAGAGTGILAGGALGWLAGIGSLAVPGLGPLIAAGPILAALTGAAVVGTVGGIAGALIGMGIPDDEARQYENRVRSGNALISVHTDSAPEAARAKEIFSLAGASDISTAAETTAHTM